MVWTSILVYRYHDNAELIVRQAGQICFVELAL